MMSHYVLFYCVKIPEKLLREICALHKVKSFLALQQTTVTESLCLVGWSLLKIPF